MNKAALRQQYLSLRKQLSAEQAQQSSIKIGERLAGAIQEWQPGSVHLFLPIADKNEVDTYLLISLLREQTRSLKIITSRTNWEQMQMENVELLPDTRLELKKWGVPEPVGGMLFPEEEIDMVVVPLLAYDSKGHRVGYGKGFYDKFLARCRPDVIKAGVSFFEPEASIDDVFESDIPLDFCFTPAQVHRF
jgi:5-formyltetrahydrofolate cyclo-ligase